MRDFRLAVMKAYKNFQKSGKAKADNSQRDNDDDDVNDDETGKKKIHSRYFISVGVTCVFSICIFVMSNMVYCS